MPKIFLIIPAIILGLIFLQGLINAINPRLLWKTFDSWKATKEPSDSYFLSRRIAGIVAMLLVAAIFLFPYIMSRQ